VAADADFDALTGAGCRVLSDALSRAGAADAALEVLERGQEAHPGDFDLCFRLALQFEKVEPPRWQDAVDTYRIAHALRPGHAEVLHRQGMAFDKLGRAADAERLFTELVRRQPDVSHWHWHLGDQLRKSGRLEGSVTYYLRALDLGPRDERVLTNYAVARWLQGRLDEAQRLFTQALEVNPENVHALTNLGAVLFEQRKIEESEERYRQALAIDGNWAPALIGLGRVLARRGKSREALELLGRAAELDREDAEAQSALAGALFEAKRLDEAAERAERAIVLDANQAAAHYILGYVHEMHERWQEAIECYERAVEIDTVARGFRPHYRGGSALALNTLSGIYMRRGELDESLGYAERAVEADAGRADVRITCGDALRLSHRYSEAIEQYAAAVELLENDFWATFPLDGQAQAHNNMGLCFGALGESERAAQSFRRALEVHAGYAPARINLGRNQHLRGDLRAALVEFRTAGELFAGLDTDFAREWKRIADQQVAMIESAISDLDSVVAGRRAAATYDDWSAAILMEYHSGDYRAIVELVERTMRDAPELAASAGLYDAACAAALWAAESGSRIDTAERSRVRELARAWLAHEFERWGIWVRAGGEQAEQGAARLRHALTDPDFASVREPGLDLLPRPERSAWQELWSSIESELAEHGR
jgi:tetratricopeptide (TPR) repeat protein